MTLGARCLAAGAAMTGLLAGLSPDRDPSRLHPGLFLYAAPGEAEPNFAETVVLLIEHGSEGSMGLVVNQPTEVPLRKALPTLKELDGSGLRVHWGGPVQPGAILALVRMRRASAGAVSVLPDVQLTGEIADVRAALREEGPERNVRVYAGYAGWAAGQLAAEVRSGFWVMEPADASLVFAPDPSKLWPRVYFLLDLLQARSSPDAERSAFAGSRPIRMLPLQGGREPRPSVESFANEKDGLSSLRRGRPRLHSLLGPGLCLRPGSRRVAGRSRLGSRG